MSEFRSFEEFWPFYLGEHRSRRSRALHVAGTAAALTCAGVALATRRPKLLALAPLLGYGPAWIGHYIIEKNRPATFTHPLWSLRGDLRMAALMATGQLREELDRLGIYDQEDVIDLVSGSS